VSELAEQLEKLIAHVAAKRVDKILRGTARDHVKDAVRIAADEILEDLDLARELLERLDRVNQEDLVRRKLHELVGRCIERELRSVIETQILTIMASDELQDFINEAALGALRHALESHQVLAHADGLARSILQSSIQRMTQGLLGGGS
jgi:hypothetical protein